MESELISMGIISIIPAVIAIVLSFATRNTIVSLVTACIVGTLLAGQGPLGFPTLLKESLGTTSFSWVMLLNTFIAIIVAYFQKTGAIQSFFTDDSRQEFKPPRRTADGLGTWNLCILQ